MKGAQSCPLIWEPDITGPIELPFSLEDNDLNATNRGILNRLNTQILISDIEIDKCDSTF